MHGIRSKREMTNTLNTGNDWKLYIYMGPASLTDNNSLAARKALLDARKAIIHASITAILDSVFQRCDLLQSVIFNQDCATLTKIHRLAFGNCTALLYVKLPKRGLIEIGQGAFRFCTSLVSIEIPSSVLKIGDGAFAGCTSLINVSVYCPLQPFTKTLQLSQAVFHGCSSLVCVALPHKTRIITTSSNSNQRQRRSTISHSNNNINYPPFEKCSMINKGLKTKGLKKKDCHDVIFNWVKSRFNRMPLHQICYDPSINMEKLKLIISSIKSENKQCTYSYSRCYDKLSMNPLHVLACNPNIKATLVQSLLDHYLPTGFDLIHDKAINGMTPFHLFLTCNYFFSTSELTNTLPLERLLRFYLVSSLSNTMEWEKLHLFFILYTPSLLQLSYKGEENHHDDINYLFLQAAIMPCSYEVLYNLTLLSVPTLNSMRT